MRLEKQYLLREVNQYLGKSDYGFLADFSRITVEEVSVLRDSLSTCDAQFHVVKNALLRVAIKDQNLSELESSLVGPTALVTGGSKVSEIAKILTQFFKDKNKGSVKSGFMSGHSLTADDVVTLAKLPSIEVLRAQLLGLLNTPAQRCVTVLQAVPVSVLNVLQAQVDAKSS